MIKYVMALIVQRANERAYEYREEKVKQLGSQDGICDNILVCRRIESDKVVQRNQLNWMGPINVFILEIWDEHVRSIFQAVSLDEYNAESGEDNTTGSN